MGRPISKTTKFILALPVTLSAKEVLSKAKASGHKTSEANIYRVRRLHGGSKVTAKTAAAPKAGAGYKLRSRSTSGRKRVAVAKRAEIVIAKTNTNGFHSNTEDLLRAVAAELGLGHALEILQSERARVTSMLGG
jgi:hypothetical protein